MQNRASLRNIRIILRIKEAQEFVALMTRRSNRYPRNLPSWDVTINIGSGGVRFQIELFVRKMKRNVFFFQDYAHVTFKTRKCLQLFRLLLSDIYRNIFTRETVFCVT